MVDTLARFAATLQVTPDAALVLALALGAVIAVAMVAILIVLLRPRQPATDPLVEQRMADLNGRIQAMGELLAKAQGQLQQTVHERLDAVSARLGDSMQTSAKHTSEHLQQLHARLAVIDSAQKNITQLATQVSSLQNVLANKQQRGAFGQGQMEAIIRDRLPAECYDFQPTLSNRARPDCCIYLPDCPTLVIDAKFPLEAVTAFREAKTDEEKKVATARVRQDVGKHVSDIAEKYLIPGETQDMALMFVPSESIYCELYDSFDDIFQKAYRANVTIVSPSLLMLAVQVIQQIRRDARMREAADRILKEVGLLIGDVARLKDRVDNLDKHFGQAGKDIQQIVTSADKIMSRGERIQSVEFDGQDETSADILPGPGPRRRLGAGE
jgi:DNA recombination protein RmuC